MRFRPVDGDGVELVEPFGVVAFERIQTVADGVGPLIVGTRETARSRSSS